MNKANDKAVIIENMIKQYDDFKVLTDINLTVSCVEKMVIYRLSGSGKSALIRCLSHLVMVWKI